VWAERVAHRGQNGDNTAIHCGLLGMRLREATLADADALARLMDGLGYPTSGEAMRRRLSAIGAHPDYHTLVAEVEGQVVGIVGLRRALSYEKNGTYVQILVLAVDESRRGVGIGTSLIREVEAWARSQGAAALLVNSGAHRGAAHRFYGRMGFRPTGLRFVKRLTS
jgi:GNAT superfamily N-acetyltransferase